jgi:hypothetical protein
MLVGSVALAQQGLISEPWHRPAAPAAAPVPPLRALPASGLGPAPVAPPPVRKVEEPVAAPLASASKWSPPVVELLVDPWANKQAAAPAARPQWLPAKGEIVDPWADEAPPSPPRVASQQAGPPRSTIF